MIKYYFIFIITIYYLEFQESDNKWIFFKFSQFSVKRILGNLKDKRYSPPAGLSE